jgi:hypothetical protein
VLGDGRRLADWVTFFERELAEAPWRDVVKRWAPKLAPGLAAAATHGIIRTAHAARSLESGETSLRLRELAKGLGYWAARYFELPGAPSGTGGRLAPGEAIGRVETLPPPEGGRARLITGSLKRLNDYPAFAGTIDMVDPADDPPAFLSDLTETFARVYLANAHTGHVVAFIHAVTGPGAARLLLPYVPGDAAPTMLWYAWQAAAGIYAALGRMPEPAEIEAPEEDAEDLIDRAVATGDEHAIKFTEACLREHAQSQRPSYLAAALHATDCLGAR